MSILSSLSTSLKMLSPTYNALSGVFGGTVKRVASPLKPIQLPTKTVTPLTTPTMSSTPQMSPIQAPISDIYQKSKVATPFSSPVRPQVKPSTLIPRVPGTAQAVTPTTPQPFDFGASTGYGESGTTAPPVPNMGNTGTQEQPQSPQAPPPPPQNMTPEAQKAYDNAVSLYEKSMQISPDELSTQEDIDKLIESTKKAYLNTQDQAIPLDFITGQLASIERRASTLAEPLERKLARLQAVRTASMESSKFALDRAEKKLTESRGEVKQLGDQLIRIMPDGSTQVVASAPTGAADGFTLGEGQRRYDAAGNLIASGAPKDDSMTPYQAAQLELERQKAGFSTTGGTPLGKLQTAQTNSALVQSILEDPKLDTVTGIKGIGTLLPGSALVKNRIDQLKSLLSLEGREKLKGSGAISDFEARLLSASASALGRNLSNEDMRTVLMDIKKKFDDIMIVDQMIREMGITEEEAYRAIGTGFNSVGSDTNKAAKIAQAIKQVESGGNYNARGGSGEGGAYQFMPATWKSWAKTYLGNANAPMTPANQDKVAHAKINDLLKQGYTPQQIALIWNGGQPVAKAGVNRFGQKYDSGAYANKVVGVLNKIA